MPKISVVIPCYFNEGNIPVTTAALLKNEQLFPSDVTFEYVFVDDGSGDGTLRELNTFKQKEPNRVTVIKLARNTGSYNAIYAGLMHVTGDCVVVMAADLQDPPALILQMYSHWVKGTKVVVASRSSTASFFATAFHWFIQKVALPHLPKGGFDFCLFDAEISQNILAKMQPDINSLYLLLTVNEPIVVLPYEKQIRQIGTSKWSLKKKFKLTWNTLFYFSSLKFDLAAYFWKKQAHRKEPFVIDAVL